MTESSWREAKKQLAEIEVQLTEESMFAEDWFSYCHTMFKKPSLYGFLSSCNETAFNHHVIWPLMDISIDTAKPDLKLMFAEYLLKCSADEYKADGCIIDEFENEICLLETSSSFQYKESGKLGYDHVKGAFGTLTLFNAIFKKYHHAPIDTAINLTITFVHARGDSLHLWNLELCSKKVYALKKVYKTKVPTSQADTTNVLALGNFSWCLKECLEKSCKTIEKMKEEHESFEVRVLMGEPAQSSLLEMVDTDIKKPVKGAGYGILLPEEKGDDEVAVSFIA
ncbi:hypothetical protein A0J61_10293 [Choanephora cucurbitarum]|uniref:Uncharacterized protein n=1 Tax=Choanephora cucurbitarum TaxID=101091 RepID=A0A1C7MXX2_9FUNG|nr:hypothetical protein A0J61_10293 [Choanephora cucurbitarum]